MTAPKRRSLASALPGPILGAAVLIALILILVGPRTKKGEVPPQDQRPTTPAPILATGADSQPAGIFIHLLDISGSTRAVTEQAIPLIRRSILGLSKMAEVLPQLHIVGVIGSSSLAQKEQCRIFVGRSNLFTGSDTVGFGHSLTVCDSALSSHSATPYTDIRGALKFAGLSLEEREAPVRGIILSSDLEEDLGPGQEAATPALTGMCVLVIAQLTPAVSTKPSLFDQRAAEWSRLLRDWGASHTKIVASPGFNEDAVHRFFRACLMEGRP